MTRQEIEQMTTAELRRYARTALRRDNRYIYGVCALERIQDIRQGPLTGRRDGWYRQEMARMLDAAGRCRKLKLNGQARIYCAEHRNLHERLRHAPAPPLPPVKACTYGAGWLD